MINFLGSKYLNSLMRIRIRDPESFLPWIRDKHPGSATLHIAYTGTWINRSSCRPHHFRMKILRIPATAFPAAAILSNTASSCSSAVAQCFTRRARAGVRCRQASLLGWSTSHFKQSSTCRMQLVNCWAASPLTPEWPEVFPPFFTRVG